MQARRLCKKPLVSLRPMSRNVGVPGPVWRSISRPLGHAGPGWPDTFAYLDSARDWRGARLKLLFELAERLLGEL